ncbi:MAG TPA: ABC transporter permease [Puia sp.]|nr:ABC transporter permease [Puia sp.]
MLKNYFTIALRNLWRKRTYTFINITGLAIGMTCSFLLFLYVHFEHSYDQFHKNSNQIYRVVGDLHSSSQTLHWYATPGPLGRAIKAEFPQVKEITRVITGSILVRKGSLRFQETHSLWADSSIFSVFDFPLIYGDPAKALKEPNSIVFTESAAIKYFGHSDPVGQHLLLTSLGLPGIVTGVMKDIPENSHLKADMLVSASTYATYLQPGVEQDWGSYLYSTYLLLKAAPKPAPASDAVAAAIQSKLPALIKKYEGGELQHKNTTYTLSLEPLTSIYLHSSYGAPVSGNLDNLNILTIIAIFLLLIAAVNFINLSTARSVERAKEVGIRKSAGAKRFQLIAQFLIESILISLISYIIALACCHFALPIFNQLAGKTIRITYPLQLLALALAIGSIAGIYPALVLSAFKPVIVLKGNFAAGNKGSILRKTLVIAQYTISIALIVCTLVVYSQLHFMQRQPLGFNKDQVLIISNATDNNAISFKNAITDIPAVQSATLTSAIPGRTYNSEGNDVWPTDVENSNGILQRIDPAFYNVDADFIPLYQIPLLAGRNFYKGKDSTGVIINKTAALSLGYSAETFQQLIGRRLIGQGDKTASTVIGIVDDFHFHSLREPIQPLCLQSGQWFTQYLSIKINAGDLPGTLAALNKKWDISVPNRPFSYFFLNEDFNSQYRSEERFGTLFIYFSVLALFITSMGLLGLSAYSTLQRTREIGIRKVLGASVTGIVSLLSGDFVRLVIAAFVIACPLSWFTMNQWLQNFAYHTTVNPGHFAVAGFAALFIALLTIGLQTIRAALANPVKSLRSE